MPASIRSYSRSSCARTAGMATARRSAVAATLGLSRSSLAAISAMSIDSSKAPAPTEWRGRLLVGVQPRVDPVSAAVQVDKLGEQPVIHPAAGLVGLERPSDGDRAGHLVPAQVAERHRHLQR